MLLAAAVLVCAAAPRALTPVAEASVWTARAGDRIFPATGAGGSQAISVSAAQGEYEGVLIGLRGSSSRSVTASWLPRSNPLLTNNATLHQVMYVRIRKVSTDSGGKAGLYPDPIVPRQFGTAISVPGGSSSLYVLFHVPYGTRAGTYTGALQVTNGSESVNLDVTLRVWGFGWKKLSTRTAFVVNLRNLSATAKKADVPWSSANAQTILTNFYTMMQQHGVTPMMPNVMPNVTSSGSFSESRYYAAISPYLGANGLDLTDAQIPWNNWFPKTSWGNASGSPTLVTYLANIAQFYKKHGWQDKAYAFIVDEPNGTSEERAAERYARVLHKASARAGYRMRFLLTDDPRPTAVTSHPANRFLFDDVDIWCTRYYYFFGRVPTLRNLKSDGKEVWWYPYANTATRKLPGFVIEKSLADARVWGWLMHEWKVDGMLYWGINRWGNALTGVGLRDPYQDPISYRKRDGRVVNGEAMLVYPGYYPRYGLKDGYAAPVSSLRLEALRDGFEDHEYLKLAAATRGGGAFVDSVLKTVTWYPYPIKYGHVLKFPQYTTSMSVFDAARTKLAQRIEAGD